jgi:hypothetical protein
MHLYLVEHLGQLVIPHRVHLLGQRLLLLRFHSPNSSTTILHILVTGATCLLLLFTLHFCVVALHGNYSCRPFILGRGGASLCGRRVIACRAMRGSGRGSFWCRRRFFNCWGLLLAVLRHRRLCEPRKGSTGRRIQCKMKRGGLGSLWWLGGGCGWRGEKLHQSGRRMGAGRGVL